MFNVFVLLCSTILAGACVVGNSNDGIASRLDLARLMVWITPGLLSWLWYAAYDPRLISVIWAPLAVLVCCAMAPIMVDGLRHRQWTGIASVAVVLVLGLISLVRLDGLGLKWKAVGMTVAHGQFQREDFRRAVMPELAQLVEVLEGTISPNDTIFSPEGRLRFFFPGRVDQKFPRGCQDLKGYDYFVLTSGSSLETFFKTEIGVPGTIEYWSGCRAPSLTLVTKSDSYAVFRIKADAVDERIRGRV